MSDLNAPVRTLRWFCLKPHFRGKSRLEHLAERSVRFPKGVVPVSFGAGTTMRLNLRLLNERALYLRNCEPDTYQFIMTFLRPGMVFYDCGANLGFYSLLAGKVVEPSGKVYAFEPTPSTHDRLVEHIKLNCLDNVEPVDVALGEESARSYIYRLNQDSHGMNSLVPEESAEMIVGECEVMSLQQFVAQGGVRLPNLMKLDVEGSELRVLRGAESLLRADSCPTMIIELSHGTMARFGYEPEDLISYLMTLREFHISWPRLGKMISVNPRNALPHYDHFGKKHGANYVFSPVGSH